MASDWARIVKQVQEQLRFSREMGKPALLVLQGKRTEPRNNDGRATCWWCGAPTKRVPGVIDVYDICTKCKR